MAAGVGAALLCLAAVVAALGPALTRLPIDALRVVIGSLLLVFGLQWLRKAILRAGGLKALHDEDAIYQAEVAELRAAGNGRGPLDWYGFTVAFKGVFLEGLEVAFIVVTFGAAQGHLGLAALGAAAALVGGARGRARGPSPAEPGAREHPQVRRGRDAHLVRHLLDHRGQRARPGPATTPSSWS